MEATEANMSSECVNQLAESDRGLLAAYPQCKKPSKKKSQDFVKHPSSDCDPSVQAPDLPVTPGVSNCYVFKSRLQEYAQKVGVSTPTYETLRDGPSHMPSFQSAVIFGGVRYESLPGFYNRKAAEQSAAEIALMDLSAAKTEESFFVPVHETGLCKNVLQEYAQKMNYAIPTYTFTKDGPGGRTSLFSCTVDIGGIQYIGATAKSKRDAEIKAARTALLAIRSTGNVAKDVGKNNLTVLPSKRKVPENRPSIKEKTSKPKKTMKPRPLKKPYKNKATPVADPAVDIANNGQSVHPLESSAEINASSDPISHIEEPSAKEGNGSPRVPVSSDEA